MKYLFILLLVLVISFNNATAQWIQYDKPVNPKDSSAVRSYVKSINILKNDNVVCGFESGVYDFNNGLWDAYPPEPMFTPGAVGVIVTSVKDSLDNLWVATTYGLRYYDTKLRKMTKHYKSNAWARDTAKSPGDNQFYYVVHAIATDSNGGLWLSGLSNGFDLAHLQDGKWTLYPILLSDKEFAIWAVAGESGSASMEVDKYGTIWYNAYGGVVHYDPKTGSRTLYDTLFIGKDTISMAYGGKICCARDGTVWMNAQLDYILNFNPKDTVWTVYHRKDIPNIRSDDNIRTLLSSSITEDAKGNIWMAIYYDYLVRFDIVTKKWKRLQLPDGRYASQGIKTFLEYGLAVDSKGRAWVGTKSEGVVVYTGDAIRVEEETARIDGFAHTWIFSLIPNPITKRSQVKFFADPAYRSSFHIGLFSMEGVEVSDLTGVAQIDWTSGHGTVEIESGKLASGVYLFRVSNGGDNYVSLVSVVH